MRTEEKSRTLLTTAILLSAIIIVCISVLTGCAKMKITLLNDTVTIELGEPMSEAVTDYAKVTPEKELEKVTLDTSAVDIMATGTYEAKLIYNEEEITFPVEVVDTTAPVITLTNKTLETEADLTVPFSKVEEAVGLIVSDLSETTASYAVMDGSMKVEGENLVLEEVGTGTLELTVTDADGNASKETISVTIGEPTYPVLEGIDERGILLTVGDDGDLAFLVTATDKKDGKVEVTVDESGLDRNTEGVYEVTYKAVDSDGRETVLTVSAEVLDMSIIDSEAKAQMFAYMVETGETDELFDSRWSKELGKKYGVPAEFIVGYGPSKPSSSSDNNGNNTSSNAVSNSGSQENTQPSPEQPQEEGYRDDFAQQMFAKINEYRVQNGVATLVWDDTLNGYAVQRVKEITINFAHEGPDGLKPSEKWGVGENIARYGIRFSAIDAPFEGWKNSSGHNANMLNGEYTKSAISCYLYQGNYYWVQIFAY